MYLLTCGSFKPAKSLGLQNANPQITNPQIANPQSDTFGEGPQV
jgi:hypothetical protein